MDVAGLEPIALFSFRIGMEFLTGVGRWRVTDLGTRTVVAIELTGHDWDGIDLATGEITKGYMSYEESEAKGWFKGPPYALGEHVFPIEEGGMYWPPEDLPASYNVSAEKL